MGARIVERRRADLIAVAADPLAQVAAVVEEADRDQRNAEVARRLEVVGGEDAEAAGVDLQRRLDAELGAEVGDRRLAREAGASAHAVDRTLQRGLEPRQRALHPAVEVGRPRGRRIEPRDVAQEADRVVAGRFPALGRELLEQTAGAAVPGPAVVAGESLQALERLRQRARDLVGAQLGLGLAAAGLGRRRRPASGLEAGRARARRRLVARELERLEEARREPRPLELARRFAAGARERVAVGRRGRELLEQANEVGDDLGVVAVDAVDHVQTVALVDALLSHPGAEARQIGRDRRHAEREALFGREAPGLVERREAGDLDRADHRLVG